jgi:ABC-type dipeptide/oligopeptide/nickel transport system permease component
MAGFLAQRLGQTIFVLFGVSLIVFGMIHAIPGDPVDIIFAGENVTADQRELLRRQLGLDRGLPVQYLDFVTNAAQGDLGISVRRQVPVSAMLAATLPATLELLLAALLFAILIAVPVAVVAGMRPGTAWDRFGSAGALFGIAMPSFWLGIMLILIFAVQLGWLPSTGRIATGMRVPQVTGFVVIDAALQGQWDAVGSALRHLILPAITSGVAIAATIARVLRSGILEARSQDHIDALKARGIAFFRVVRHILRNALPATVTVMGVRIGTLLGGQIVVETVFSWPGLGRLIVDAIRARDFPTVQGAVLVMALLFVLINLLTDFLYAWLDPRVRYGQREAV